MSHEFMTIARFIVAIGVEYDMHVTYTHVQVHNI